mgnify:CR=1 FL=1
MVYSELSEILTSMALLSYYSKPYSALLHKNVMAKMTICNHGKSVFFRLEEGNTLQLSGAGKSFNEDNQLGSIDIQNNATLEVTDGVVNSVIQVCCHFRIKD